MCNIKFDNFVLYSKHSPLNFLSIFSPRKKLVEGVVDIYYFTKYNIAFF